MRQFVILFILLLACDISAVFSQDGEAIFKQNCAVCHQIGTGRLVGPDLLGINNKRDSVWLVNFIKSSQTMIRDGDEEAVKMHLEYNKIIMPDFKFLSDVEIMATLKYIESFGDQPQATTTTLSQIAPESGQSVQSSHNGHSKITESFNKIVIIGMFFISILIAGLTILMLQNLRK